MRVLIKSAMWVVMLASVAAAQNFKLGGYCEQGGQTVTTQGLVSTTTVQRSYVGCTVTVYQAGTLTLATIFSDSTGTAKANPFTASATGYWSFYVPTSSLYDVRLSGGGITSPFTLSDMISPGTGATTGTVTSVGVSVPSFLSVAGSPVTTSGTLAISLSGGVLTAPIWDKGGQVYNINAYGGDPTGAADSAVALRAAIAANETAGGGGEVLIPATLTGNTYLLSTAVSSALATITKNVTIRCTGGAKLQPAAAIGATTDVFLIKPAAAYIMDALVIEDCYIQPVSGTPARHAFAFDLTNATAQVRKHLLARNVVKQLGGRAVNVTVNHADAYFTNDFVGNYFYGPPIFGDGTGDSIRFYGDTITSNVADQAMEVTQGVGSGGFEMRGVNFTAGGGVIFHAAVAPLIQGGMYELANGALTTAATNAIIYFQGDVRTITHPVVQNLTLVGATVAVNGFKFGAVNGGKFSGITYNLNAGSFLGNIGAGATAPVPKFEDNVTIGSGGGFTGAGAGLLLSVGASTAYLGIGLDTPLAPVHLKGPSVSNRGQLTIEGTGTDEQITFYEGATLRAQLAYSAGDFYIIAQNGRIRLGGPTLFSAGAAAAGNAPIKMVSGPLLTTPEVGAIEFLTDTYYATITTGAARRTFPFLESSNRFTAKQILGGTSATVSNSIAFETTGPTEKYVINYGTAGALQALIIAESGVANRLMLADTSGNLKLAGTAVRATTEGTNHLDIYDGTAPVGTLANGISLYSTAGELRVMDAAGNATLLSPHDHTTNEWIYFSVNTVTGRVLRVNMERLMRALDSHLGGGFIQEYIQEVKR